MNRKYTQKAKKNRKSSQIAKSTVCILFAFFLLVGIDPNKKKANKILKNAHATIVVAFFTMSDRILQDQDT